MKDKKKKYTCHTCHFPIYEGEEFHKSETYKSKSEYYRGVSRSYSRVRKSWVQCNWCITEFKKEKQKYDNWIAKKEPLKYLFYGIGILIGISLALLINLQILLDNNIWLKTCLGAFLGFVFGEWTWKMWWNHYHKKYSPRFDRYRQRDYRKENE